MLEQCNFYEHQILAAEAQEWIDHCADYNNEVMAANDTPVIKTMPIDLEVIKEHQDAEKCAQKMLGQDKRFHVKISVGQNPQQLTEHNSIYCASVIEL